jgi:hypothetical protein
MSKHLYIDLATPAPANPSTELCPDETILIRGQNNATDSAIKAKADIDSAGIALEQARATLEPLAKAARLEAERAGHFTKAVQFQGSEQRATFSFTNAFRSLDLRMRAHLSITVGPDVTDHLFEERERTTLKADKAEELRKILKAQGLDPDDFLETDQHLAFNREFRRRRFELRPQLSDAQNNILDHVEESAAARPALTTK